MTTRKAKQHTLQWDWLSLVDADGPFLSRAALKSFYPNGLPKPHASVDDVNETFIEEFTRWSSAWSAKSDVYDKARDRWVETVLRTLLDWDDDLQLEPADMKAKSPNGAVTVQPYAILKDGSGTPAALVTLVNRTENLRWVIADGWSANAIDRMAVLLRETGVSIGLVTDGRWWALVSTAKGVTTASGVWDALLWREERPSRDAFLALASYTSLAGDRSEKRLPLVFAESVTSAEQITEALGNQARRAVELVLQSMSDTHLRAASGGDLSPLPADPRAVYEAAVTVLMRIVFLLFAEERGLLPEHDLYRSSYAIARLREQLQHEATATSAESLDHSWEAWHRLLAASNAVYGGANFEDMRMPAYGGSLFDPERYPWLQTTDAQGRLQVRLTDRAMLAVLRAVQTIEDGAMQLSFRDLDVEQIGYVYEGLLGYSAEYVTEVVVALQGKAGSEPSIPLRELENLAMQASSPDIFGEQLVVHLKKSQAHAKSRTAGQLAKAFGSVDKHATADARTRLRHALLGDDELAGRLEPFRALVREDLRGFPYVVPAGGLVMTESSQRANTGTHYTPRALAEEVVLNALEPLVYSPGPLNVEDSNQWKLKSSAEILELKVADIAAGSGAFLVAAARYLADRLIEARELEGVPIAGKDPKRFAIREVVARCLYGADINGMAVEMCKLSLWLISLDPGKPFSFVDDRVFHGNSLLGVTSEAQLKAQHIFPTRSIKRQLATIDVDKHLDDAARLRRELASGQVDDADRMRSTRAKRALLEQSKEVTAKLRDVADGIIAAGLLEGGKPGRRLEDRYEELAGALHDAYPLDASAGDRRRLDTILEAGLTSTDNTGDARRKPLHWLLEAPDVIYDRGGFDAVIGNPPFLGGPKVTGTIGTSVRDFIVNVIAQGQSGSADLVVYFLLRSAQLAPAGSVALIATKSVAQGDSRRVGLDQLHKWNWTITRAIRSRRWPSRAATVDFAAVWLVSPSQVVGSRPHLEGRRVSEISSLLEEEGLTSGLPSLLVENAGIAFIGSYILGQGFVLDEDSARAMIDADPINSQVVRPYLVGEDLNNRPDLSARRFVIDFFNDSFEEASTYAIPFKHVEVNVKPERQRTRQNGSFVLRKPLPERWWQYAEKRPGMRSAINGLDRVIAVTLTSNAIAPQFVSTDQVIDQTAPIFATDHPGYLAALNSNMHRVWAIKYATTFGTGFRYSITKAFQTFPFPTLTPSLVELGERLHTSRLAVMSDRQLGVTALYRLINSPSCADADIQELRLIESQIDCEMLRAYGWADIKVEHGFYSYRALERWTLSPIVREAVLDALLGENQSRSHSMSEGASVLKPASKRIKSFEESTKPEGALI